MEFWESLHSGWYILFWFAILIAALAVWVVAARRKAQLELRNAASLVYQRRRQKGGRHHKP